MKNGLVIVNGIKLPYFLAPGYGETAQLAITDFSLQELADNSPCPVEAITD